MPRKKRNQKRSQVSSVEQSNREIEGNHEDPMSQLVSSVFEVTTESGDAVSTTSLVGSQTCLSSVDPSITQPNSQSAPKIVSLDQSLLHGTKHANHKTERKEPAQVSLTTPLPTPTDDTTLLNIIESVDHDRAIDLLKGNYSVSQEGLDKALLLACQRGYKYIAQRLVGFGANVNYKDSHGNTSLLISAENGFTDIVRTLIMRKADINACNSEGDTALILSIRSSGSTDMVTVLLAQEGININHQNRAGHTALMKAMEVKDIDTMEILMDKAICFFAPFLPSFEQKEINESERCGLESIFQILKIDTYISPLFESIQKHDIESFNIFLDCQCKDIDTTKRYVDKALSEMFYKSEIEEENTFTDIDIRMINKLLEYGADISINYYTNPLSVAVKVGNFGLVELLCKHMNTLNKWPNQSRKDALQTAATIGRCDLVELLLRYQADINEHDFNGSALDCAFIHGHIDVAKLLIQHGAKMDIVCALESAVDCQLPQYMNFLFENYEQEIQNHVENNKAHINELFISAVKGGNLVIISHILDAGADVNNEDSNGETPIANSKNGEVATFLVSRAANINYVSRKCISLLLNILKNRYRYDSSEMEVVQVLLDHGANISDKDQEGQTALMHAVCNRRTENVSCLLKFAKENTDFLNLQNLKGLTALMCAAIERNFYVVQELIDHGADVNIKDVEGNNALLHALSGFYKTDQNIVTTLVKAGSDVNYQNNAGFSPLMLAAKSSERQSILILLDSGADVNAVSKMDNTKTALSVLANNSLFETNTKLCIEEFLDRGASSSYINQGFIHKLIVANTIRIIHKLIRCGFGPSDVTQDRTLQLIHHNKISTPVSPLCVSLLDGNDMLACYFEDMSFLTTSDVSSLASDKIVRNHLKKKNLKECLNCLDYISTHPRSLFKLALVSVSSAVGISPGRENRVNILPLPQVMKDKLLFKTFIPKYFEPLF